MVTAECGPLFSQVQAGVSPVDGLLAKTPFNTLTVVMVDK